MRLYLTTLSLAVALLMIFAPKVQSAATDRISEAGEKLRISPKVRYTLEGTKAVGLNDDLLAARDLYEKAIYADSNYAPARYSLAKLLLYVRADSAMIHARKAYYSDTTNVWYLSTYAQSMVGVERYDEAVELYKRLIELHPRDLNAYRILAILYNRDQKPHEAIAILDSAELRAGRHNYLMALKRQLLLSINRVDQALEETQAIVREAPYVAENRVALAELYAAMECDSLAKAEYAEAMRIDSTRIETLLSYGAYLEKHGYESQYLEVIRLVMSSSRLGVGDKVALVSEIIANKELYRREYLRVGDLIRTILLQTPKDNRAVEMQTRHLIALGMIEEALKYMKQHLDDEPQRLEYYRMVVSMERHLSRPDSVEHYLQLALQHFPNESSLRHERAYILTAQKRYDEAIACYDLDLRGATDSMKSFVYGFIGDIYHQMSVDSGDEKSAAKHMKQSYRYYDRAIALYRNNIMVLNNYAYFLSENGGDLNKAHDLSKYSIEIDPSNPTFLDTYAWILYRMGQFAEAKVFMRQAISFDTSQNGEIALHYAEILSVLGESTMANFYWDKAVLWGMTKEQVEESQKRAKAMADMELKDSDSKRKR